MSIVLSLPYEIHGVDCCSYAIVDSQTWERAKEIILEENLSIQAYINPSPMELHGSEFEGKDLVGSIDVIDDPKRVEGFRAFFGEEKYFCTGDNMLGNLFDKIEEILKERSEKALEEEEKKKELNEKKTRLWKRISEVERRLKAFNEHQSEMMKKNGEISDEELEEMTKRFGTVGFDDDELTFLLDDYRNGDLGEVESLLERLGM